MWITLPTSAVAPHRAQDVDRFCTVLPDAVSTVRARSGPTACEQPPPRRARGQKCPRPSSLWRGWPLTCRRVAASRSWPTTRLPGADIPAWCRLKGHTVSQTDVGEHTAYPVVVGPGAPEVDRGAWKGATESGERQSARPTSLTPRLAR